MSLFGVGHVTYVANICKSLHGLYIGILLQIYPHRDVCHVIAAQVINSIMEVHASFLHHFQIALIPLQYSKSFDKFWVNLRPPINCLFTVIRDEMISNK